MSTKPWRPRPAPRARAPQTPRMRHFARVCLTGLLHDGKSHEPCGRDIARYVGNAAPDRIDAIALLRTGKVTGKRFDAMRRQRADMPLEALCAEFAARTAALGDMRLPLLLVMRSPGSQVYWLHALQKSGFEQHVLSMKFQVMTLAL